MAEGRKSVETGKGIHPCVKLFLQGGGSGGTAFWFGVLGADGKNDASDGVIPR